MAGTFGLTVIECWACRLQTRLRRRWIGRCCLSANIRPMHFRLGRCTESKCPPFVRRRRMSRLRFGFLSIQVQAAVSSLSETINFARRRLTCRRQMDNRAKWPRRKRPTTSASIGWRERKKA